MIRSCCIVFLLFVAAPASADPQYWTTAQWQAYLAGLQAQQAMGQAGSSSKLMQMMAMMNMMSAQMNLAAAQTNKSNGDKQAKSDKAETDKSAQITDLKLSEFKAPEPAKEESGGVDMKQLSYASSGDPAVPQAPLPEVSPDAALQIVSQFQPVKPEASPIPPAPEAPKASPAPEGVGRVPAAIPQDKKDSEDSRIGYDQSAGALSPRLGSVPLAPQGAPPAAGPQSLDGGNVTALGDGRKGRNATADTPEVSEGTGVASAESGGSRGGGDDLNINDMLGDLFGNKGVPGPRLEEIALPAAEKEEDPGSNIFEYASYRYRKLNIKPAPKRSLAGEKTAKK